MFRQLVRIKKPLDRLACEGSANDLVVIYFQGVEVITRNGHVLALSASKIDPNLERSGFSVAALGQILNEMLGAKLVLLDVTQKKEPAGIDLLARFPEDDGVGVVRYSRPS